jgi:flavin-dependent dehydrogenase
MEISIKNVEIAIIGAGHGGLVTATHLSNHGYDVHVFEKLSEEKIGYEWHDAIDPKVFSYIELPELIQDLEYSIVLNHRYIFPEQKKPMNMNLPPEERSWAIHRKSLIKKLLNIAKKAGVIIHYGIDINKPLLENDIIQGIIVEGNEIRANLVIDNAGLFTPIRSNLPESYGITRDFHRGQIFTHIGHILMR